MSQCLFPSTPLLFVSVVVAVAVGCICFSSSREVDFNQRWIEKPKINQQQRMRRNKGSNGMNLFVVDDDDSTRRTTRTITNNFLMKKKRRNPTKRAFSNDDKWIRLNFQCFFFYFALAFVQSVRKAYLFLVLIKPDEIAKTH